MSRWRWALLPALLCSIFIVSFRPPARGVLDDTDTAYLLTVIRANPDPVSHRPQSVLNWFVGDWPLHNHFYRPISTLSFEMDTRLHGDSGSGYVLTNAIVSALCVSALFWFLKELTDSPFLTGMGALIFGLWNLGNYLPYWLPWLGAVVGIGGLLRSGLRLWPLLLAAGSVCLLVSELSSRSLGSIMVSWIPARTATIMTLFCLLAMGSYARFARVTSSMEPREKTPLDPPATRNTERTVASAWPAWPWLVLSLLCAAFALGSHEQAIMLPGAIVGVGVSLRLQRFCVSWWWPASFFLLLVAYMFLRHELLPTAVSQYQAQQLRTGPGVMTSLLGYALPDAYPSYQALGGMADLGATYWITAIPYQAAWNFFSNLAAFAVARRRWVPALTGWALSLIAFLPMAWVKPFPHYDYWPLAMRSLFVAALMGATGEAILTAWSPRAIRLPSRRAPAPGSLPRP